MYYIRNRIERSKVWRSGWQDSDPIIFTEEQTLRLPLPPCGEWVEIPAHLMITATQDCDGA